MQYVKVHLGTATTQSDRYNILRYYEQGEFDNQASKPKYAMLNDPNSRIQAVKKKAKAEKPIKKHGASASKRRVTCKKCPFVVMGSQQKLIVRSKTQYGPTGSGVYCIGSKSECSHLEEDGAIRLNWGETPQGEQLGAIHSLYLRPTEAQLAKSPRLPDFIRELPQLRFLDVPLLLALTLSPNDLPTSLESLTLLHWDQYAHGLNLQDIRWPDVVLPGLKSFSILSCFGAPELPSLLGVSNEVFPQLKHLHCRLDRKGAVLTQLAGFTSLQNLELEFAYNHDVFSSINSPLQSLSVEGANKGFSLTRITAIPTLELLWLNGMKAEIDCALFRELPYLVEVSVLNSRRVSNVQALLQCPNLESLYFLDCGNPFKGVEHQFREANYPLLDIEFS